MGRAASVALLAALAWGGARADGLVFSGYYKSLAIASETAAPAGEAYGVDVNRLRLALKGALTPRVAVDLQYDNEVLVGSYLRTDEFALQAARPPDTYLRLAGRYAHSRDAHGRHRLHRGHVTVSSGDTDLRVGRQRVAWGTGRLWSPLDLLNPLDPTALERGERVGVDAVLVERKFGAVERLSLVHAGHRDAPPTTAVRWHGNAAGVDHSFVVGRVRGARTVGFDVATQLGGAGLRAELARHAREAEGFSRAMLGLDYAFPGTLTVTAELHFNGAGSADRARYAFAERFAGRVQSLARRYAGGHASYDLTPLWKTLHTIVWNLDDRSRYYAPSLVYSVRPDVELTVGVQRFVGSQGSEFGTLSDVVYAQVQWFF